MTSTAAAQPSTPPTTRWRHRRRLVAVAVLLAVCGVLGWATWWATHPTWFPNPGGDQGARTVPGRALWVSVTFPNVVKPPVTLHLDSVRAHVVSDTSDASVSAFVCTNRPQFGPGLTVLGTGGNAMMRHFCVRRVPAHDVDMTVGRGHPEYLLLEMVPAQPGRLRMDRVDVTYRKGLQRGSQGLNFKFGLLTRPHHS